MKSARRNPAPPLSKISPDPKRSRRLKWFAIALVSYAIIGFLILPPIIRWQLRKQLPALTHRQAEVKQVRLNPFALSLTIRGLALTETNGAAFAAFDEFYANFELSSLFRAAWTFGEIRLVHPTANFVRLADGSFNFSNLIDTNAPPKTNPPSAPPKALIQSLLITNAIVTLTDQTTPKPFHTDFGPVNLALTDFTTRPDRQGAYNFVATTADGERFTWSGDISLLPPRSRGKFEITGIPLPKYSPYLALFTTAELQRGTVGIAAAYRFNAARIPVELDVTNAAFTLSDLWLKPPEREDALLAIKSLCVTNTSATLTGHLAHVGAVLIDGGSTFFERGSNGQPIALNYLLLPTNQTTTAETPATNTPVAWHLKLDDLTITNFNVAVEDHSTFGVAEIGLDQLAVHLKDFSNESNAPLDLAVQFNWRGGGTAKLQSHGTLSPLDVTTRLDIDALAIPPVQPYLGQFLNLVVHTGAVNVAASARFNPTANPMLQFSGDVGVTNFSSSDTIAHQELAVWQNHTVRGIDFTLRPNRLNIDEIRFVGARNSIAINSNGVVNVAALPKLPPREDQPTVSQSTNSPVAEAFPIHVGAIILENNSFRAVDDSLLRRFETHIAEINGSIRDITLPGLNRASVDIRGKVSALAPFLITGSVTPDPKNLFVDLKIAFTNTDLTPLSPYMEKFVGRPLTIGKLTSDQFIHIENNELIASNVITLDRLTLGGRVESPYATGLPVKLAIGLLKDINGRIDLDIPISGRLDDPNIRIWGLVGQTFKNLLLRVAASPFSLLGSLVGGGEELQYVEFAPGLKTLDPGQTNKLFQLATALSKRPALGLEISATIDIAKDNDALGRQKLLEQMKNSRIEELVARGKTAPPLQELILEPNDYERLLRKAYRASFNETPEQALLNALNAKLGTNTVSQSDAPVPSRDSQKGATVLMSRNQSLTQLAARANTNASTAAVQPNTKPRSQRELVIDEMELRLVSLNPATKDESRALLQQRIETVQKFLVEQAGVSDDRILVNAPNIDDSNRQGAARVVFSLE